VLISILVVAIAVASGLVVRRRLEIRELEARQASLEQTYDFDPGNLISDAEFFNSSALSAKQIQKFLTAHGNKCSAKLCLKSAKFKVAHMAGDELCSEYDGKGKKLGAQVIAAAAQSCGISPKVLLVMLEKEQGIVSTAEPTQSKYDSALGLSCPDTAACDKKYSGFFKQVYGAAKRFKYYSAHPDDYPYEARSINYVQYHPQTACGGSNVYIENEATALLYIYTPYQPNAAALEAAWGSGDNCSSYGNRNFVLLYKAWFG
jgi:hypothetical protein